MKKKAKKSADNKKKAVRQVSGKYYQLPGSLKELPESYRALIRELAKR